VERLVYVQVPGEPGAAADDVSGERWLDDGGSFVARL
jgi:hypothetical protein